MVERRRSGERQMSEMQPGQEHQIRWEQPTCQGFAAAAMPVVGAHPHTQRLHPQLCCTGRSATLLHLRPPPDALGNAGGGGAAVGRLSSPSQGRM